jgi:D-alanyl-D-alanine carboxypeptidase/D-alanyl-D-alanine-endopeptidase (penicillin-binding protein 4)
MDTHWGPGWAWEDYDGAFAPERSALPIYGNMVQITQKDSLEVRPAYFKDSVLALLYPRRRKRQANIFFHDPSRKDTVWIPFQTSPKLSRLLLEQASGQPIALAEKMPDGPLKTLYGQPTDSIYKRMMQESDNFLAEQLLLSASGVLSDSLNSARLRSFILDNYLKELNPRPVWVDGSGLSRYNLFSPESMVLVLNKMYKQLPRERLFNLFAAGGVSGTIKKWYAGEGSPYVYAKTGTLANNHCLSGYLLTRSGRTLIFSFMNNHYVAEGNRIKEQMQGVLEFLRDNY